jgi:hypothetical protein
MHCFWFTARHNHSQVIFVRAMRHVTAVSKKSMSCRLRDVLWDNCRLYLIMDYVELDLREHMDQYPEEASDMENIKVQ